MKWLIPNNLVLSEKCLLMKLLFILMFLSGIIGINNTILYAGHYSVPECINDPDWSEQQEMTICNGNEDDQWSDDCPDECCVTIAFFERRTGPNNDQYEIFIAGYETEPGVNYCNGCDYDQIFEAAIKRLLYDRSDYDPDFKSNLPENRPINDFGLDGTYIHVFTNGLCKDPNNSQFQCTYHERCCTTKVSIRTKIEGQYIDQYIKYREGYGHDVHIDPYGFPMQPPCPDYIQSNCTQHLCNQSPRIVADKWCYSDCGWGAWSEDQIDNNPVEIPGMPGCAITQIVYQVRKPRNCPYDYIDFRLVRYTLTPGCSAYPSQTVHSYVIQSMLKFGMWTWAYLDINECNTDVRFFQSPCWKMENNQFKYCEDYASTSNCCWKKYRICRVGDEAWTFEVLDWGYTFAECTPGCFFFCDPPAKRPDMSDKIRKEVADKYGCNSYPSINSLGSTTSIHFKSDYKGIIKLAVFDISGNLLFNPVISKSSSECIIPLNNDNFSSGNYLYCFYITDELVCKGNFTIVK